MISEKLLDQWDNYDESFAELTQWVKDMEVKVKADGEFKTTLEDKKARVQKCKVNLYRYQLYGKER